MCWMKFWIFAWSNSEINEMWFALALVAPALGLLAVTLKVKWHIKYKVFEDFIFQFSCMAKFGVDVSNHIMVSQAFTIITFVCGDIEEIKKSVDLFNL